MDAQLMDAKLSSAPACTDAEIEKVGAALIDRSVPAFKRFRVIFTLKNIGGEKAVQALVKGFGDDSALLKHEVAFVLGQMQEPSAIPALEKVLRDTTEDSMVRHEAGEALGAIGRPESLVILREFANDPIPEIAETCSLALDRIQWAMQKEKEPVEASHYQSVDPAPPSKLKSVPKLKAKLLDPQQSMFERYRALFALRNLGGKEAIEAMAAGLEDGSALLRHEVAYVLGQMQDPQAVAVLSKSLAKADEHPMVRHEAAEALGAIATEDTLPIMHKFAADKERVVRESCEVALDVAEYMNSNEFQYADTLQRVKQAQP